MLPCLPPQKNKDTEAWTRCCLAPDWKDGKPKCASREKPVILVLENQHYTWLVKPKFQNIGSMSSQTPSVHTLNSVESKCSPSLSLFLHACQSRGVSAGKPAPESSKREVSQVEQSQPQTANKRIRGKQSCPTVHTMDIDLDMESCGLDEPAEVSFSDPTTLRPAGKPPLKDSRPSRQNRVSTINGCCPICQENMTLTGHDKA